VGPAFIAAIGVAPAGRGAQLYRPAVLLATGRIADADAGEKNVRLHFSKMWPHTLISNRSAFHLTYKFGISRKNCHINVSRTKYDTSNRHIKQETIIQIYIHKFRPLKFFNPRLSRFKSTDIY